jgi:adenylate cyclase
VPPDSIAARLHARPDVTADACDEATIVIADVVGLAELKPAKSPDALTVLLEEIFARFDALAQQRGLKKIKTLGNSYLAAAGVPVAAIDHASAAANFALDMVDALSHVAGTGEGTLQLRVGIASGPVVAGVIGRRSYVYDVWGDTVNTASRMESHGVAGRIQAAESTRRLLGDPFVLEARGALAVEGQGEIETWFVNGRHRGSTVASAEPGPASSTQRLMSR